MTENRSIHLDYALAGTARKQVHAYRTQAILRSVGRYYSSKDDLRILDVGCGRGELMSNLKEHLGAEVFGMDIDSECAAMGREHGKVWLGVASDIHAENQLNDHFDVIVSSHSMEHMPFPPAEVAAMKDMAKRFIVIAVPNPHKFLNIISVGFFQRIPKVNEGHYYCWDAPHLKMFLEKQCGLSVVEWFGDVVKFVPGGRVRNFLIKFKFFRRLEGQWLPRWFPRLSNSLMVVCSV